MIYYTCDTFSIFIEPLIGNTRLSHCVHTTTLCSLFEVITNNSFARNRIRKCLRFEADQFKNSTRIRRITQHHSASAPRGRRKQTWRGLCLPGRIPSGGAGAAGPGRVRGHSAWGLKAAGLSRLPGGAVGPPGQRSPCHGGAATACQLGVAPGTHSRPPVEQRAALPTGKAFAPAPRPSPRRSAPPPIGAVRLSAARSI